MPSRPEGRRSKRRPFGAESNFKTRIPNQGLPPLAIIDRPFGAKTRDALASRVGFQVLS